MDVLIEDLFYIYKQNDEAVVALRGLHLTVNSGECLVIKGPNGSGKSTLVKLLTGFLTPTAGKILIGGQNISKIDPLRLRREFVSSIDQSGNILGDITIMENIALAYTLTGATLSVSRKLAEKLLAKHGFEQLSDRYHDQLSAGQRQFASLLAAIATNPKVLIADEPSGELDNTSAEIMYGLLKSLAGDASVILVTHDSRAERYADRIVRIREGRISEEWLPGGEEESVIDPLGWKRVREILPTPPSRSSGSSGTVRQSLVRGIKIGLTYGSKEIFSNLSIDGASGELIALSSASGSGKSSFLRILSGIQNPTKGEISLHGQVLKDLNREKRAELLQELVGFLWQGGNALAHISLADHVGHLNANLGETFGARMNQPLSAFSGGERARIELLKILGERKPILILDEPTSQMDERRSMEAARLLLDYVQEGGLVIASTRDEILLRSANHVINVQ